MKDVQEDNAYLCKCGRIADDDPNWKECVWCHMDRVGR